MTRVASLAVFVIALLALQQSASAQGGVSSIRSVPPAMSPAGSPAANAVTAPRGVISPLYSNEAEAAALAKYSQRRTGEARGALGAFNGFSMLRQRPDLGAPGSAGNGFSHFPQPMDRYTNWYRPRASSLTQYQRCEPDDFRPKGLGHLFARPADGFRMDYEPYAIADGLSSYGPAYPARMPDPRCDCCECCDDDCEQNCEQCDPKVTRRRSAH
jgi:hypothetical protein